MLIVQVASATGVDQPAFEGHVPVVRLRRGVIEERLEVVEGKSGANNENPLVVDIGHCFAESDVCRRIERID
jgi:hypothetical protein